MYALAQKTTYLVCIHSIKYNKYTIKSNFWLTLFSEEESVIVGYINLPIVFRKSAKIDIESYEKDKIKLCYQVFVYVIDISWDVLKYIWLVFMCGIGDPFCTEAFPEMFSAFFKYSLTFTSYTVQSAPQN